MRRRKTPRRKLIEKLDKLAREYIVKRDNYTCQRCGKKLEARNCHVSHVIPRTYMHLRWDEMNLKVLCFRCHIMFWHKNPLEAAEWFKNKFPNRWEYLEKKKKVLHKYTISELEELVEKFNELLKDSQKTK